MSNRETFDRPLFLDFSFFGIYCFIMSVYCILGDEVVLGDFSWFTGWIVVFFCLRYFNAHLYLFSTKLLIPVLSYYYCLFCFMLLMSIRH